jgi:hypothetical protein
LKLIKKKKYLTEKKIRIWGVGGVGKMSNRMRSLFHSTFGEMIAAF